MQSATLSAARAREEIGLPKTGSSSRESSAVQDLIAVYTELARRCDYALHLGLTEAGMGSKGIVASSAAMGVLLQRGMATQFGSRSRRSRTAIAPAKFRSGRNCCKQWACGHSCRRSPPAPLRTHDVDHLPELAAEIQGFIRESMPEWKKRYPGVETLNVAGDGCIVNGPGESKHAISAFSLPGTGEQPTAPVFIDAKRQQRCAARRSPPISSRWWWTISSADGAREQRRQRNLRM